MTRVEKQVLVILSVALVAGSGVWAGKQLYRNHLAVAEPLEMSGMLADVEPEDIIGSVNINNAGVFELEALPGIGPTIASRIISYREQHGPFNTVADIQQVSGIGPKRFEAIHKFITVSSEPPVSMPGLSEDR